MQIIKTFSSQNLKGRNILYNSKRIYVKQNYQKLLNMLFICGSVFETVGTWFSYKVRCQFGSRQPGPDAHEFLLYVSLHILKTPYDSSMHVRTTLKGCGISISNKVSILELYLERLCNSLPSLLSFPSNNPQTLCKTFILVFSTYH